MLVIEVEQLFVKVSNTNIMLKILKILKLKEPVFSKRQKRLWKYERTLNLVWYIVCAFIDPIDY